MDRFKEDSFDSKVIIHNKLLAILIIILFIKGFSKKGWLLKINYYKSKAVNKILISLRTWLKIQVKCRLKQWKSMNLNKKLLHVKVLNCERSLIR